MPHVHVDGNKPNCPASETRETEKQRTGEERGHSGWASRLGYCLSSIGISKLQEVDGNGRDHLGEGRRAHEWVVQGARGGGGEHWNLPTANGNAPDCPQRLGSPAQHSETSMERELRRTNKNLFRSLREEDHPPNSCARKETKASRSNSMKRFVVLTSETQARKPEGEN